MVKGYESNFKKGISKWGYWIKQIINKKDTSALSKDELHLFMNYIGEHVNVLV